MIISYKNKTLRTAWDCATLDAAEKDKYAAWAGRFESEIETQCDNAGIDPELLNVNIDEYVNKINVVKDPADVVRGLVRHAKRRLRMI